MCGQRSILNSIVGQVLSFKRIISWLLLGVDCSLVASVDNRSIALFLVNTPLKKIRKMMRRKSVRVKIGRTASAPLTARFATFQTYLSLDSLKHIFFYSINKCVNEN